MRTVPLILVTVALFGRPAGAAFVVIANHTEKPIACRVVPKGQAGKGTDTVLVPGEARAFRCGKTPVVRIGEDGTNRTETELEPYNAYVFVTGKDRPVLKGIEFAGKPVPTTDVREDPPDTPRPSLKIPVRLLMDDANPLVQSAWEPKLKKRFQEAGEIVGKAANVTFELTEIGTWKSDPAASSLDNLISDLEETEKPANGGIVVAYTCRNLPAVKPAFTLLGPNRGWVKPALLIRDGIPASGVDQVEVLAHELAHNLGAVRLPDPNSVMRPTVGDGKANLAKFEIRFDPINVLLMNLWVEDLHSGKVKRWNQLRPETIARLGRVYETIWKSNPDVPLAVTYQDLVAAAPRFAADLTNPAPVPQPPPADVIPAPAGPAAPKPDPIPAPAAPKPAPTPVPTPAAPNLSNQEKAIRRVVRGMTLRVVENAKKPDGGVDARLTGDELTADLVRTAANIAAGEEEGVRLAAFAVGLGLALDDSTVLRDNPLVRTMCRNIEPDADRKERIAALGSPTVRTRRDLCQHFAVSVALAELVGPKLAEQAGVAKEFADMQGTSGFSFTDLAADLAGVEFYSRLKKDPTLLDKVRDKFAVADYVPELTGLADGLNADQFASVYGTSGDERYKAAVADLRAGSRSARPIQSRVTV